MTRRRATLLLAALAGCTPRPPAPADAPAPSTEPVTASAEAPAVTLERMPCFGTCPVYQVSISGSGLVRFVGKQHTAQEGEAVARIPAARVDSLLRELDRGGYFELADSYVMGSPACGQYATDSPTVITSVASDGQRKTIRHDYGCSAAPRELSRLERLVDDVAGTARWVGP